MCNLPAILSICGYIAICAIVLFIRYLNSRPKSWAHWLLKEYTVVLQLVQLCDDVDQIIMILRENYLTMGLCYKLNGAPYDRVDILSYKNLVMEYTNEITVGGHVLYAIPVELSTKEEIIKSLEVRIHHINELIKLYT